MIREHGASTVLRKTHPNQMDLATSSASLSFLLHPSSMATSHLQFVPPLCSRQPHILLYPPLSARFSVLRTRPCLSLSLCSTREALVGETYRETPQNGSPSQESGEGDTPLTISLHDEDELQDTDRDRIAGKKKTWNDADITGAQELYGEVNKIIASRAIDYRMFYLIEWKDGHEPSWVPASSIAKDVLAEYESPWWKAARAVDDAKLSELLADENRDVDAVDENGRTALLFASGLGSEKCVRLLVEAGADVDGQDLDGLTPLHMATGYARQNTVSALIELGADPELADSKGRTPIGLAQELIEKIPKANPLQFARRLALENILKILESELYETVEVEQVLDRRSTAGGDTEYLVKWKDGAPDEWVPAESVADDLIKDFEAGLEYGIAEEIVSKRSENGKTEYLVRWADTQEPTWEPFDNVAAELIAEYEKLTVAEVEKMQEARSGQEE